MDILLIGLFGTIAILIFLIYFLYRTNKKLTEQISSKESQQKSLSTIYGRISEQWFPLMPEYPYDPQNFRFLGSPIDGIQFTDNKIIFCEFKVHKSGLNQNQKRIKELIKNKEVEWVEFRFNP